MNSLFPDPQEEELKRKLLSRQYNPSIYDKPLIGNEQTAGIARNVEGGLMTLFGAAPNPKNDIATKIALLNYKDQLADNPLKDELMKSQINANNSVAQATAPEGFVKIGNKVERDPGFVTDEKKQNDLNGRLKLLTNDLDPSRYRSGAFGISKQVYDRGERLKALADQSNMQAGGADKRQMEEFAIGLNAMLSGSNTGAQQQVAALVPHTWWGGAQGIKEYLSNNPTGLDQQKFVGRMMETIDREMTVAKQQMDRTRYQRLAQYKDVLEKHKPEFEDTLQGAGMDPEEYYNWQKQGNPPISATGVDAFAAAKNGNTPNIPGGSNKIPSFNTLQEAEAQGYKGPAVIGGVKGVVS